ncbi:recombinase family protein [Oscillospiraceae bacterium OttesenSCG-928-F05]|nr:recombinase family protein [Oscillospiraceae bacterium OttesenSCG-928-F05]
MSSNAIIDIASPRVAIYCRLSKEDEKKDGEDKHDESASIQNQEAMLRHYCAERGWTNVTVYPDDGYTGLNMNRPQLTALLKAVRRREIDIVITKDMSRLGRNYLETGQLIEEVFPKFGVRYIAINDNIDTSKTDGSEMTPFKAVMNQMYSADISRKVHSAYVSKAQAGLFTGCVAPFGYRKHPDNKNLLIPDEDTAPIIRQIFKYAREGHGPNYIRRRLEDDEIPCPTWWNRQKGIRANKFTKHEKADPEHGHFIWDFTTIKEILQNPVYIGAIASQKQEYKFKAGWIKDKKPDEWLVKENVHEPLVSREVFEIVQEKVKIRKRPDAFGNYSIFAGLVKCGQCGSTLNIRRANQKGNERIYTCSKYNKLGVKHCSQHRIKYDVLYGIVLEQIQSFAALALKNEDEVIEMLASQTQGEFVSEHDVVAKSINEDTARLAILDKIVAKLYEDMIAGTVSTENFDNILAKTQAEQKTLKERVQRNQARIQKVQQDEDDNARWLELIKEYVDIQELDAATLQRLIKTIVVHEDFDGDTVHQTVEITFNFKGTPSKYKLSQ